MPVLSSIVEGYTYMQVVVPAFSFPSVTYHTVPIVPISPTFTWILYF